METIVLQPLCNVLFRDPSFSLDRLNVDDELVSYEAVDVLVFDTIVLLESVKQVVRIQYRNR